MNTCIRFTVNWGLFNQMTEQTSASEEFARESSSDRYRRWPKNEVFSRTCIPPETPFFVRLDGWRFQKLVEELNADRPFDERVAECLVASGEALFLKSLNPSLIYVASDELNILFADAVPFRGRVEKMDSVLASLAASAFSLNLLRLFSTKQVASFDSRIITALNTGKVIEYMSWRQTNACRNHNNTYAYWIFRKMGYRPAEIARKLKGLTGKKIHELMLEQGVNLTKTPQWQRRGILVYKQPFAKKTEHGSVTRWKLEEEWNLPLFSSEEGLNLVQRIVELTKQKRKK